MRKKAKQAGSQIEPAAVATTVVSGSIQASDESDALKVELDFSSGRVTMHADGAEIGSWPSEAVSIDAIDSITFSFVAEGDRLIFSPDDPGAFGIVPLVEADAEPVGKRSRRKSKRKTAAKESPAIERESAAPATEPAKKPTTKPAKKPAKKGSRKKQGRSSRKLSGGTDKDPVGKPDRDRASAKPASAVVAPGVAGGSSTGKANEASRAKEKKTGMWIRTLDTARRHDFFGLNRVQINEELRGQVHEHTWDHRVAPKAGPGKHICTICGRIRR